MTAHWRDIVNAEVVGEREKVCTLPGGETVERQGRSLIVSFPDRGRAVLSSAKFNGGFFTAPSAVINTTSMGGEAETSLMSAGLNEHIAYYRECAKKVGLDPDTVVGLGTAVTMDKAAIVTKTVGRTSVSAVVTAGVEGNGGRAGDPASYDQSERFQEKNGTIVIILLIKADLPAHSMARAIITATEAKTCALQQLMAPSVYSTGIATGSGTDQIAVVCDSKSKIKLTDAGKHSLLGELIGKCVTEAVLKALDNWAGLNPVSQRDAMKRLARYKVGDSEYLNCVENEVSDKDGFITSLKRISTDGKIVAAVSSAIHIQDEIGWGILTEEDGKRFAEYSLSHVLLDNGIHDHHLEKNGDIISNATLMLSYLALKNHRNE